MRNALILLAVVALVILAVGALNNGTAFDVDYVAGTAASVSLFWVSLIIAAIVFVAGLAAAWFALAGAAGGRHKLEAELQSTYERLRQTEREADEARSSAAAAAASTPVTRQEETVVAEREEETIVLTDEATVVADEAQTIVVSEAETVVADETETIVAAGGAEATAEAPDAETAAEVAVDEAAGEQTAVTIVESSAEDGAPKAPQPASAAGDATAAEDAPAKGADAGGAPGTRE